MRTSLVVSLRKVSKLWRPTRGYTLILAKHIVPCCIALAIVGCGDQVPSLQGAETSQSIIFTVEPQLVASSAGEVTLLHFATATPTQATYQIHTVTGSVQRVWDRQTRSFQSEHFQPLPLDMATLEGSSPAVVVTVTDSSGATAQKTVPLAEPNSGTSKSRDPDQRPVLSWQQPQNLPPYTLVNFSRRVSPTDLGGRQSTKPQGLLQAYDRNGQVVWRYSHSEPIQQVLQLNPYSFTHVGPSGVLSLDLLAAPIAWLGGQAQSVIGKSAGASLFVTSKIPKVQTLHAPMVHLPDGHSLIFADLTTDTPMLLELSGAGAVVKRWLLQDFWHSDLTSASTTQPVAFVLAYEPSSQTIAVAARHLGMAVGFSRVHDQVNWRLPSSLSSKGAQAQIIHSLGFADNGDLLLVEQRDQPAVSGDAIYLTRLAFAPVDQTPTVAYERELTDLLTGSPVHSAGYATQVASVSNTQSDLWIRRQDGRAWVAVDPRPGAKKPDQLVASLAEVSAQHWVIEEVLPLNQTFSHSDFAIAARRGAQQPTQNNPVSSAKTADVSFYGLGLSPDLTERRTDLSGRWDLTIADAALAQPLLLTLTQDDAVVAGDLDGQSLIGLIRGNTFSTTYRVGFGKNQSKFKYRGLVDASETYMEGHVGWYRDDQLQQVAKWEARKR